MRCEVCSNSAVNTVTEMMRDAGYHVPSNANYVQVDIAAPRIVNVDDDETKVCKDGTGIGKTMDEIWTLVLPASCGTQRVVNLSAFKDVRYDSE